MLGRPATTERASPHSLIVLARCASQDAYRRFSGGGRIVYSALSFGRIAAHSSSMLSAGHIALPHSVRLYSTFGGTCG
jgi:hypothetical protein